MNDDEPKNLVWVDIETTGTRILQDAILEVGICITTQKLELVCEKSWVCSPSRPIDLSDIHHKVIEMHSRTGLLIESNRTNVKLADIEGEAIQMIYDNDGEKSPACGSSVHFDRGFLSTQAPHLNAAFHYRNIDVSTVRNLCQRYQPEVYKQKPDYGYIAHRVLDDLHASIAELRHYMTTFGWIPQ